MKHLLASLAAAALVLGCEPATTAHSPGGDKLLGYLEIYTPRRAFDVLKVTPDELVGPDVQVYREGEEFRGRVKDQPIEMRLEKTKVTGSRGGLPIDLHLTHAHGALVVRGLYGGRLTYLKISKHGVGDCAAPAPDEVRDEESAPCVSKSAETIEKMLQVLGDDGTAAFLAAAHLR